jgi:AcrR family transcriptional regulator
MSLGALTAEQQRMVLDAAAMFASAQELSSITLDHLAKASGVRAFDIARHYQTKEKILAAVLQRELEFIAGSVPSPELRFPGENAQRRARGPGQNHASGVSRPIAVFGKALE